MIRAQCIVNHGTRILMVKHRLYGDEWWCLPGGGVELQESPAEAAIRELQEECCVSGLIVRQTGHAIDAEGMETVTFLVDIGDQQPRMGDDPEFAEVNQYLSEMRWLTLAEIPERDRAYLWASGLMCVPEFLDEVSSWGNDLSYPADKT